MSNPQVKLLDHTGKPMASYNGAGRGFGGQLANWTPPVKTVDAALLPKLNLGNARADDVARNNGIASGGIQLHVDNIVGHLFRLSSKPRWKRLGISEQDARALATDIESAWQEYAEDEDGCWLDAERKRTFTMMIREGVATHTRQGEIMSAALWLDRPGSLFKTAIKMVSPKRVSNPQRTEDTDRRRGGIDIDAYGAAVAYHVRNHAQASFGGSGMGEDWERIPRETAHGRRQFLHVFEPMEDGQTRGANQFLSVMEQLHMLPKLQNTKLQNAIVNAMYAAVIESELGSQAAFELIGASDSSVGNLQEWMTLMAEYHNSAKIKMDGVQIPHLVPGEQLKLHTSGNVDNGFVDLEESILRWTARGLNVPYESLAQNYSKTNYSSARASMLEGWRYFMGRRKIIASRYASMIYTLWLEEAIHRRIITLPRRARRGFYEAKSSWCNAEWIGSGRLAIDGLKEVKESILRIEAGLSTYEKELAQMGEDYQEVFAQQVREMEERRDAGLPPPSWVKALSLAPDEAQTEAPSPDTPGDR